MGYRLMENQPWVGMVPQLIPLLLWGVQALMRRGMRGSPEGQIQGLGHLSRGRAEQRTTPVPRLSRGGRKDRERCRCGLGESPCPTSEVLFPAALG